ncbi:MAG: type II secretion system protein N [Marinobacter sp.]|uniref:type II secretion system protein N n=1 Tax=Marinobacter sp. TaxID=50741 RepID=UPI0034A09318
MTDLSKPAFLRPGKVIWLGLAGLLVYLIALVFLLPAGWVWQWVSPQVNLPPQVQVNQVSGQLWNGAAGFTFAGHPLRLSWDIETPSLLNLSIPMAFSLDSARSGLDGRASVAWPGSAKLTARGSIRVREFEDLIRRSGGAMLVGDVVIDQLVLAWVDGEFSDGQGRARWAGGEVTWPMGGSVQSADFPPMEATLNASSGRMAMAILQQGENEPAANADIFPDGVLEIRVYKRMIDLAGQSWSGAASPGDVIFRVRQPLLGRGN